MEQPGKLIVITGATVSGKDTVMAKLLKINPAWKKVVTTTTRPPRPDERNGIDYNFINLETFQKMKAEDEFLETVEYAGNSYGTAKSALNPVLHGQTLIWRIDASRATKVDKLFDNVKVIYLKLPDHATRQKHFLKRGMKESDIEKRIKQDEIDWNVGNFKNVVINYEGKLNETIQTVEKIIND